MYIMRLALRPWRDAPWSQVFSSLAVGFLLVLVGLTVWMQEGLTPVITRLRGEQVITAYLDPATDPKSEAKIVDSIRLVVGAQAISDLQVVQPEGFVKKLKGAYPDLARELEDLGPETNTLVPRFVSVSGILPSGALENVKAVQGIESAESSRDRYLGIIGGFTALRTMLYLLGAGLALALFTGLMHLSRLNAGLMSDAASILKLFGASSWSMRSPAMLSGLFVGAGGGAFAFLLWMTLGLGISSHIRELSPLLRDVPPAPAWIGIGLLLASSVAGVIAAGIGTFLGAGPTRQRSRA